MPSDLAALELLSRIEAAQRTVSQATLRASGNAYFAALVQALAGALGVHYVIAGRLIDSDQGESIQTLAVWGGDAHLPNLQYALLHTPCRNVADQVLCFHPQHVQADYPFDTLLADMGAESYIGMPMVGAEGQTLGILVALDRHDMREDQRLLALSLLTTFAARGAAELQHQEREARLERLVQERTDALQALQRQLVERETLAALGGLVAGISHELNTPVGIAVTAASTVEDSAQALQTLLAGQRISRSELQALSLQIGDAARLTLNNLRRVEARISTFKILASDRQDDVQSRVDLGPYLERKLAAFAPALRAAQVEVTLQVQQAVQLHTSVGLLAQVLDALIGNALVHAFDGRLGGRLQLRLTRAADTAVIHLCDDGPGVTAEVQRRLFEPFFTTTRGSGGVGLGLPIAYVLAQRLGGRLAVDPAPTLPGLGFVLTLPLDA